MTITSLSFAAFVLVVLIGYYALPRRPQNYWLLLASYIFIASWSWKFAAVLMAMTAINFVLAQEVRIGKETRRSVLWLGLGLNIAALLSFKNAGFFIPDLFNLFSKMGWQPPSIGLQIILPLGLSYYTLQAISYLLDVSRGQMAAATDLVDFGLYLAYFPKLVAGPIERAKTFLPKLAEQRIVDNDVLARSFTLIMIGLFRKIVLADPLTAAIDPQAFYDPGAFAAPQLWLSLMAYAFALYNDFAGYTSIVRGVSGLFGIELSPNFQIPYFSRTFNEFWNRWHISLSHWLRDYVYLPLSRSLLKRFPDRRHLVHLILPPLVTMTISGLWHAAWDHKTILVWGVLHGLYQIVERIPVWLGRPASAPDVWPRWQQLGRGLIIFLAVILAWVLFRDGSSVGASLKFWLALLNVRALGPIDWRIPIGIGIGLGLDWLQFRKQDEVVFIRWPLLARSALLAFAILAIFVASQSEVSPPFVYQGF
jgi:D-alanyl-lipoteichoic acid acyltransferase DltB (MBOAT superfamily)